MSTLAAPTLVSSNQSAATGLLPLLQGATSVTAICALEVPPPPEEVDPTDIPREHRQLFLDTIRDVITADGEVARDEWENLALFEQLLR